MSNRKISKRKLLEAIRSTPGGVVSAIAARLGVSWSTARAAIDADPECLRAWLDERERLLDAAENALMKSISNGDTHDAKWVLARLGKRRGWGDQLAVTGEDGDALKVIIEYANRDDNPT
jgi:hypothetical protein